MRRAILVLLALALCAPACAAGDDVLGKWYLAGFGDVYYLPVASLGMEYTIELREDGTMVSVFADRSTEGTWWKGEYGTLTLHAGDIEQTAQLGDGYLVVGDWFSERYERRPSEFSFEPLGDVDADVTDADFEGEWLCTEGEVEGLRVSVAPLPPDVSPPPNVVLHIDGGGALELTFFGIGSEGDDDDLRGTWRMDGGTLIATLNDMEIEGSLRGGRLVFEHSDLPDIRAIFDRAE